MTRYPKKEDQHERGKGRGGGILKIVMAGLTPTGRQHVQLRYGSSFATMCTSWNRVRKVARLAVE
jgi:hypothetical protein